MAYRIHKNSDLTGISLSTGSVMRFKSDHSTSLTSPNLSGDQQDSFDWVTQVVPEMIALWWANDLPELPMLDQFTDAIYVKDKNRKILFSNEITNQWLVESPEINTSENTIEPFLDSSESDSLVHLDELVLVGCHDATSEHTGLLPDGKRVLMKTYRCGLPLNSSDAVILGITRILGPWEMPEQTSRNDIPSSQNSCREETKLSADDCSLSLMAESFNLFPQGDQELCRLTAMGSPKKTIATVLKCTPRTIENRRRKILQRLGLQHPVELTKMMVRLADRSLIPMKV